MTNEILTRCEALLAEIGKQDILPLDEAKPLTGGVASDIAMVRKGDDKACVKFALAKLKVAAEWHAPVHRNAAEYAWLKVAADVVPEAGLKLYGRSDTDHGFAMEFLQGEEVYLWKDVLLAGQAPKGEAALMANMLGKIHQYSAKAEFDTSAFQNRDDFYALRIEPYLAYTAQQQPVVAEQLTLLADDLYASQIALVHGDVSPKNIFYRDGQPVLLDAECATMGDPVFDLAFCLNHLVIKSLHVPAIRHALWAEVQAFWDTYESYVDWEDAAGLQQRLCRLLPALMLGRVDGKSPVEYLDTDGQAQLRNLALQCIQQPQATIKEFIEQIKQALEG